MVRNLLGLDELRQSGKRRAVQPKVEMADLAMIVLMGDGIQTNVVFPVEGI